MVGRADHKRPGVIRFPAWVAVPCTLGRGRPFAQLADEKWADGSAVLTAEVEAFGDSSRIRLHHERPIRRRATPGIEQFAILMTLGIRKPLFQSLGLIAGAADVCHRVPAR